MSGFGVSPEPEHHLRETERPPTPWPASPPPAIAPAARGAMRSVVIVIGALVVLVAVGGLGAVSFAVATSRVVTDTQELPAGMRSLTVDTGGVPVPVRIIADADAKQPRVALRLVTRTDDTQLAVHSEGTASRVTLGDSTSGFASLIGTSVSVVLPPDVARKLRLTVNHRTGPLISDADLDELVVKSDDASLTLGGSARSVRVSNRHGYIRTSTGIAVSEGFEATSEFGDIWVEFRSAPRNTEAIAGGNVTVRLPASDAYRVNAGSEDPARSTTVTVSKSTDRSAPTVVARSRSGNVDVSEAR